MTLAIAIYAAIVSTASLVWVWLIWLNEPA